MPYTPDGPPSRRWRPTWALHRAVLVGFGAVTAGVLTRRPDVVLLGLPLLAVATWTVAQRPRRPVGVAVDVQPRVLREGSSGALTVQVHTDGGPVAGGMEITAALPMREGVDLQPARGCAVVRAGAALGGGVAVRYRPARYGERPLGPLLVTASAAWGGYRVTWRDRDIGTVVALPRSGVLTGDGRFHTPAPPVGEDRRIMLLLDATTDVGDHDEVWGSSLDRAVRAAAALAEHCLRRGDRVGLSVLTSSGLDEVPARSGLTHARQVDGALARISLYRPGRPPGTGSFPTGEPSGGWRPAGGGASATPARTVVVVLTPLLSERVRSHVIDMAKTHAFLIIDTLPDSLQGGRRALDRGGWAHCDEVGRPDALFASAWRIRLLERDGVLRDLTGVARVPVVAWQGPAALDTVLAELDRRDPGDTRR